MKKYLIVSIPFIGAVGYSLFKPVLPIWIKELSDKSLYAGLSSSLFMIGRAFFSPLGGLLHDRGVSQKRMVLFSITVISLTYLFFSLTKHVYIILLLSLVWGMASGILWPQLQILTARMSNERRARNMTLYYISGTGGMLIGNGLLGILFPLVSSHSKNPYSTMALISMSVYIFIFLVAFFLIERRSRGDGGDEYGGDRRIWSILYLPAFFAGMTFEILRSIYLIYLKEYRGMDVGNIGSFLMLTGVIGLIFSYPVSQIADRVGVRKVIPLPIFFYGIGSLFIVLTHTYISTLIMFSLLRIGQSLFLPLSRSYIVEEGGRVGTKVGLLNTFTNLGAVIGPPIAGLMYDLFGGNQILSFILIPISGFIFIMITGYCIWRSSSE